MTAWLATKLAHKLAPFFVIALGLVLLATLGGWGVTAFRLSTARLEAKGFELKLAQLKGEHQELLTGLETVARAAAERERLKDHEHQEKLLEIENERKQAEKDAEARERKLRSDFSAGLVRVRAEVCAGRGAGSGSVPRTTTAAGVGLRAAEPREHPALAAVRDGSVADAEIRQCRATVIAQAQRCPQAPAP